MHVPQSGQSPGGQVQHEYLVPAEASDEQHVDEPAREPLVVEEDSTPPVEAAVPPMENRRSTRSRREPDRLEVDWGGKSYEKKLIVPPQDCMTASHSLDYSDCLYPARPGGGEGFYGGGSAGNLWSTPELWYLPSCEQSVQMYSGTASAWASGYQQPYWITSQTR